MFKRRFAPFLLIILSAAAQTLTTRTYGGSGNDAITSVILDAGGNIYVTTTSFDLPVLHASQPQNSGTSLVYSTDAGLTWLAASNPIVPDPNLNTQPLAVDPTNAQVVYTLANGAVLKSTDGGLHFSTVGSLPGAGIILVDPTNPQTLYAEADSSLDTVYTSTDSGATWNLAAGGLPNELIQTLSIDPFSGNLWLTFDDSAWILKRGAVAWSPIPIPLPSGDFLTGGFSFDHATQGVVYGPSFINSGTLFPLESTDGGQTWTLLKTPFLSLNGLVTDAVRAGYVYYLDRACSTAAPMAAPRGSPSHSQPTTRARSQAIPAIRIFSSPAPIAAPTTGRPGVSPTPLATCTQSLPPAAMASFTALPPSAPMPSWLNSLRTARPYSSPRTSAAWVTTPPQAFKWMRREIFSSAARRIPSIFQARARACRPPSAAK
jgi:hypothetical protein